MNGMILQKMVIMVYIKIQGQLQVVLADAPLDERINVVGYIEKQDIDKLKEFRNNHSYTFIK